MRIATALQACYLVTTRRDGTNWHGAGVNLLLSTAMLPMAIPTRRHHPSCCRRTPLTLTLALTLTRSPILTRSPTLTLTLTLQRLRGEMVLEYGQRQERRTHSTDLAQQQQQQATEKRAKDAVTKRVVGVDHWPFRTEEQVTLTLTPTVTPTLTATPTPTPTLTPTPTPTPNPNPNPNPNRCRRRWTRST